MHYSQAVDIPERYRASAVPADAPLPPGTSACEAAWHRYAASQACFDAYRLVGGGLKPERWSASGYGDTDPVKANDTPENKQANRRCELVVLPNVEEMLDLKTLTQ